MASSGRVRFTLEQLWAEVRADDEPVEPTEYFRKLVGSRMTGRERSLPGPLVQVSATEFMLRTDEPDIEAPLEPPAPRPTRGPAPTGCRAAVLAAAEALTADDPGRLVTTAELREAVWAAGHTYSARTIQSNLFRMAGGESGGRAPTFELERVRPGVFRVRPPQ